MPDTDFSWKVAVAELRDSPQKVSLSADAEERRALADRFGFRAIPVMSADTELTADGEGALLTGRVRGQIIQSCGITLEDVIQDVDERFSVRYVLEEPQKDEDRDPDLPDIELIEGGMIPVGESIVQYFALAAEPYPRAESADYTALNLPKNVSMGDDERQSQRANPFFVLQTLKEKT